MYHFKIFAKNKINKFPKINSVGVASRFLSLFVDWFKAQILDTNCKNTREHLELVCKNVFDSLYAQGKIKMYTIFCGGKLFFYFCLNIAMSLGRNITIAVWKLFPF